MARLKSYIAHPIRAIRQTKVALLRYDTTLHQLEHTHGVRDLLLLQKLDMDGGRKLLHWEPLVRVQLLRVIITPRVDPLERPPVVNVSGVPAARHSRQVSLS